MNAMIRLSPANARRPVHALHANYVALRAFTALAMMVKGNARREEWLELADSCNTVEALVSMGKYDEASVRPQVDAAIQGLVVAIRCPDGMKRMGPAIQAMREVVTLHDEAICKFSSGTMAEAYRLVVERTCSAQVDSDPSVTVVRG